LVRKNRIVAFSRVIEEYSYKSVMLPLGNIAIFVSGIGFCFVGLGKSCIFVAVYTSVMNIVFSKHSCEQMFRRGINHETVMRVVSQPDQTIADNDEPTIIIYQSLVKEDNQMFLLRVFVNREKLPNVIVTVYKTTKISKYYES